MMKLINGHLSYRLKSGWDTDLLFGAYKILKDNPSLLAKFKLEFFNNRQIFNDKYWYVFCSLMGFIENKTSTELIKEGYFNQPERIRQVFYVGIRKLYRFLSLNGIKVDDIERGTLSAKNKQHIDFKNII